MIDIEDRKQAEKEFRKLLDVFPQYMCVYGADASPLYANDGLLEFFGFTLDDFRADDFQTRAFHPDDVEKVRDHVLRVPECHGRFDKVLAEAIKCKYDG